MNICIIGAGPSGLSCAINAKRHGNNVTIYEKNNNAGKKLLLTGNGRCNYGNISHDLTKYHSHNPELIPYIINETNLNKLEEFYNSIGIIPKIKNGYIYPYSEKSSSILSSLKTEIKKLAIPIIYNKDITSIKKEDNHFIVDGKYYDKVVISSGGSSYPKTGSTGTGYEIAKYFHHQIIELNPSLMALTSNTGLEKEWSGKRCEVDVSYYEENTLKKTEHGEIQFTKDGLSGICIFNLSRDIRISLNNHQRCFIHINFVPFLKENIKDFLNRRSKLLKGRNISEICDAFLDYELVNLLFKSIKIDYHQSWEEISPIEQDKVCSLLTDFIVPIQDTKGFLDAQTTSGGVSLEEIDLSTMESKLVPNLYFTGEVLDIDGDCGGYNLTIAFLTGLLAGEK